MVGKREIIIVLFLIGFIFFLANSLINFNRVYEDNQKINNYTFIINSSDSNFRFAVIGDYGLSGDGERRVAELVNYVGLKPRRVFRPDRFNQVVL